MKNLRKGFTLVEMLIVVVIIGILAAALLPKLGSAQGQARDVARIANLKDLNTAATAFYGTKGYFPITGTLATNGSYSYTKDKGSIDNDNWTPVLTSEYLTSIPSDPQKSTTFKGLDGVNGENGKYQYILIKKNGSEKSALVIMSKVEREENANWTTNGTIGVIKATDDSSTLKPCTSVVVDKQNTKNDGKGSACTAKSKDDLRYINIIQ